MTRLLRVLGIGKRAQHGEPERYADQPPRAPSTGAPPSEDDRRRRSSAGPVTATVTGNGEPPADRGAVPSGSLDSVHSSADRNALSIDDPAKTETATAARGHSPAQDVVEVSDPPAAASLTPDAVTSAPVAEAPAPVDTVLVGEQAEQLAPPEERAPHTSAPEQGIQGTEQSGALGSGPDDREAAAGQPPLHVDTLPPNSMAEGIPAVATDGGAGEGGEQPAPHSSSGPAGASPPELVGIAAAEPLVEPPVHDQGTGDLGSGTSESCMDSPVRSEAPHGTGLTLGEAPKVLASSHHGQGEREDTAELGSSTELATSELTAVPTSSSGSGPTSNWIDGESSTAPATEPSENPSQVERVPQGSEEWLEAPREPSADPGQGSRGLDQQTSDSDLKDLKPRRLPVPPPGFGQAPAWLAQEPSSSRAPHETPAQKSWEFAVAPQEQVSEELATAALASEQWEPVSEELEVEPQSEPRDAAGGELEREPTTEDPEPVSKLHKPLPEDGGGGEPDSELDGLAAAPEMLAPEIPAPDELRREELGSEHQAGDRIAGEPVDGLNEVRLAPRERDQESGPAGLPSSALGEASLKSAMSEKELIPDGGEDVPPGLEPGLQEIVRRLVPSPVPSPAQAPSDDGEPSTHAQCFAKAPGFTDGPGTVGENASIEGQGDHRASTSQPSTETSANRPQKENISPARTASKPGRGRMGPKSSSRQRRPNVSRETLSFGEVADKVGEDEVMEDEAAIAVREAALRAVAEVAGVNSPGQRDASADPQGNVSRETARSHADVHGGGPSSGTPTVDEDASSPEETAPMIDIEQAARDARVTFKINRGAYNRFAIAVANQKGGVGKSTTAVNLGAYLALAGARVLVVDLDPQGNASTGLGLDHRQIEPSVYDVLMGDMDAASAIRKTPVTNLDVLPSTIDLAGAEVELVNAFSRETRLRQALGAVRYSYDLVFIDCPPSLGLLTVNALAAADELLIPIQCEYYALEGLGQLLRNVDLVRVNLNQALHIGGIVLTMYDGRTRLAEQVVQEVRKHFTDLVYQTVVPRSVRLSEAPGYGVPIALYDPLSRGGIAYRDLALELADRTGLLAPTREGAN